MILAVDQLEKTYRNGFRAVRDVSFAVEAGEIVALVGESGCGKTTTLKCINRLLEPSGGRVLIETEDAAVLDSVSLRRRIGWVMQGDGLFPHLSVAENVAVTPQLLGWEADRISSRVDDMLELVRLDPLEHLELVRFAIGADRPETDRAIGAGFADLGNRHRTYLCQH